MYMLAEKETKEFDNETSISSMQDIIIYEQPLNERIRTFLRLEFLFKQLRYTFDSETIWDSRIAVSTFIEILSILSRGDLKTEILKELERQTTALNRLREAPNIDYTLLDSILKNLNGLTERLVSAEGQLGNELRQNELLKSIIQRSAIPGGTCDFDLPNYHFWLQQPPEVRHHDLTHWYESLEALRLSVGILLQLLRESAEPETEIATGGILIKTLDASTPNQLIRVLISRDLPFYAEISGGKHRFTVRFLEPSADGRAKQTTKDIEFKLTCCAL